MLTIPQENYFRKLQRRESRAGPEQYLKIVAWLQRRYKKDGKIVVVECGEPTRYSLCETLAWQVYILGK